MDNNKIHFYEYVVVVFFFRQYKLLAIIIVVTITRRLLHQCFHTSSTACMKALVRVDDTKDVCQDRDK